MTDNEFTKILQWPGYRVYRHEIDESNKRLKLWVRLKRGNQKIECSGCGRKYPDYHDVSEREVRDLPWSAMTATVVVEAYRVRCTERGVRVEKVEQLPSKAPFSKRFEDAVGQACEGGSAIAVGRQFRLPARQVLRIDKRHLQRWAEKRKKAPLRHVGVDEIHMGRKEKFFTVVSNLETGEPLWFGKERKEETLDEYFRTQLNKRQRGQIEAACVDMWEPFTKSILKWSPGCKIVFDKFHVMQHANDAIDEVRRAEFFRKGIQMRELVKGKRWLLLRRWVNLDGKDKQLLNDLFRLNRRLLKAYLLKESLDRLWTYTYETAALRYLNHFQDLARMLLNHHAYSGEGDHYSVLMAISIPG